MTRFETLDEALANVDEATELCLDCTEITDVPESIGELKGLEELHLFGVHADLTLPDTIGDLSNVRMLAVSGPTDCSVAFPGILFELAINELHLKNFRVREIAAMADRLERFSLSSRSIFDDISPLCRTLKGLKYLKLRGQHSLNQAGNKKNLVIPPEIAEMSDLTEIEFVGGGIQTLPAEFAGLDKLRTLRLNMQECEQLPPVITELENLVELEFTCNKIKATLPDELERMESLRHLDLTYTLQPMKSAANMFDDDDNDPLPPVLGKIPGLETLVIDDCGAPSFEPLSGLSSLRCLSAESAVVRDLSPLSNLPLEELRLKRVRFADLGPLRDMKTLRRLDISSSRVKDLSPLSGLENLEELIITGAIVDERGPLTALEALIDLPKLEKVVGQEIDAEQWQEFRQQTPVDAAELVAGLTGDDFDAVVESIRTIAAYSAERSTRWHNALIDLFDLQEAHADNTVLPFPPLDEAMSRWIERFDSADLVALFRATFVHTTDGWEATAMVLDELIRRRDADAQNEVVQAFKDACEYYDSGHRFWEDYIHDQLCDDFFARFEAEPLTHLLSWAGDYMLDSEGGDCMGELFVPALEKLEEPNEVLFDRLKEYGLTYANEGYGEEYFDAAQRWIDEAISGCQEVVAEGLKELAAELTEAHQAALANEADEADEPASESEAIPEEESLLDADAEAEAATGPVDAASLTAASETAGVDALIDELGAVDERGFSDNVCDYAAAYVNNKLIQCLMASNTEDALRLFGAYIDAFDQIGMPAGAYRNELASNAIVLAVSTSDDKVADFVVEILVPDRLVHTGLAYNLSCFWATRGQRKQMLDVIRVAIELGKPKENFLADSDFADYVDDEDFLAALEGRDPS